MSKESAPKKPWLHTTLPWVRGGLVAAIVHVALEFSKTEPAYPVWTNGLTPVDECLRNVGIGKGEEDTFFIPCTGKDAVEVLTRLETNEAFRNLSNGAGAGVSSYKVFSDFPSGGEYAGRYQKNGKPTNIPGVKVQREAPLGVTRK